MNRKKTYFVLEKFIFYIFFEWGVAEVLIHEVSSGQKFLEVVVADVNGDRHADGGPEQEQHFIIFYRFDYKQKQLLIYQFRIEK